MAQQTILVHHKQNEQHQLLIHITATVPADLKQLVLVLYKQLQQMQPVSI